VTTYFVAEIAETGIASGSTILKKIAKTTPKTRNTVCLLIRENLTPLMNFGTHKLEMKNERY
jgi:hypothetical protein